MQLKSGSCFTDRLAMRPYDTFHYDQEFFEHDGVVKGDEFGINIRKREGNASKAAFARKPGDDVSSCDRPGSLHVVPSKHKTAGEFHEEHVSHYQKRQAHTAEGVDEPGRKKHKARVVEEGPRKTRADKGCSKIKGARAAEEGPRATRSDKGRPSVVQYGRETEKVLHSSCTLPSPGGHKAAAACRPVPPPAAEHAGEQQQSSSSRPGARLVFCMNMILT